MRQLTPRDARTGRIGHVALGALLAGAWVIGQASPLALGQEIRPPAPQALNMELVGHTDLGGRGRNAGVWAYRSFAYVGSSGPRGTGNPAACQGLGVAVVDIGDPSRPAVVTSIAQRPGTSAEDVQALAVESPSFRGDLLASGLQACAADGVGGLSVWDVTDPRKPNELGFFEVGRGSLGVHEFALFRREGRAMAALAVPFSEVTEPERQGDLRIVDLSDPRAPVQLSHWGAERALGVVPRQGIGRDARSYAHSVFVSPEGRFAYVSYWDAGVIILDIADLRNPRFVGRTGFEPGQEGNAHSVALAKSGRVLVQADEDVFVRSDALVVEGDPALALVDASYGAFRGVLQRIDSVGGSPVFVGRGCPAGGEPEDAYLANPDGRVAIVEQGGCPFTEKVLRAQRQGALGVIIASTAPGLVIPDGDVAGISIPAAVVERESADLLRAALERGDALTVRFGAQQVRYNDWGFLRFWDVSDPANPVQMSSYATENALTDREKGPPDAGWYSVHHPVVLGDRLYAAWYSDGVRVLDIADPTRPRQVGYFIPSAPAPPAAEAGTARRAAFVWGVFVRGDLVLLTDEASGLYIVRELTR